MDPLHEKKLKGFRIHYSAFWSRLVSELHASGLVLDDLVVDRTTALLIALSWWEGGRECDGWRTWRGMNADPHHWDG